MIGFLSTFCLELIQSLFFFFFSFFFFFLCVSESHGAEGVEGEGCALGRERAKTAHWSDPGVVRMEIRPDRFKVVAAKTLGKIYGYVKISLEQITTRNCCLWHRRERLPSRVKK